MRVGTWITSGMREYDFMIWGIRSRSWANSLGSVIDNNPPGGKRSPGPLSWLAVHEPYDQYERGGEKVGESRPAINQIIYSLYCALVNTYFRWPGRRGGPGVILALLSLDIAGVPSTDAPGSWPA